MGEAKRNKSNKENKNPIGFVDEQFSEKSKLYAHTNEQFGNIVSHMGKVNSVLTVAASGDQLLNLLANDVFKIDTFDINKYTDYYINLRLSALKNIKDLEELWHFLYKMHKHGYDQSKYDLDRENFLFWDYLFNKYTVEEIYHILFRGDVDDIDILDNNNYFDVTILEEMKASLKYLDRLHFNTHLFNLHSFIEGKEYDAIVLSNIYDYVDSKRFLRYLYILRNYLTKRGKIYYSYQYDVRSREDITQILMKGDYKDSYEREQWKEFDEIIENTELVRLENKYQFNKNKYYSKDAVLVLHR